jgi:hypothetical protein
MDFARQSYIFHDVFSMAQINLLRQDQHQRPQGESGDRNQVKHLDYNLPDSVACQVIRPKLNDIIDPDHRFTNGCYREARYPYATHIDNYDFHQPFYSFEAERKHSCAVLIPLIEDPEFRTVLFDLHSNQDLGIGRPLPDDLVCKQKSNDLDPAWFSHISEPARGQLQYVPVDKVFEWRLGSMVTWPRTQLHASTDFSRFGLCKRFAILFID